MSDGVSISALPTFPDMSDGVPISALPSYSSMTGSDPISTQSSNTMAYLEESDIIKRNLRDELKMSLELSGASESTLVSFDGENDPTSPLNWPFRKKVITTVLYSLAACWATLAIGIYSAGQDQIAREFGASQLVVSTGLSMTLFGQALGSLLWAPLCELYGRKWVVLVPYFIASAFSFGTATAMNIQTILITRFFTGFFGCSAATAIGGVLTDMWSPKQRGMAYSAYDTMNLFTGPTMGPVIGAIMCASSFGWRSTEYLSGFLMAGQVIICIPLVDETYEHIVLTKKARQLRIATGSWALHSKREEWNVSGAELATTYLLRPMQMMVTPICLLVSTYACFVYAILYANLKSISIEYENVRGWPTVTATFPFIAILVGVIFAAPVNLYNNQYYYLARFRLNGHRAVPEARLPPMIIGAFAFTAGLFIFAWTSAPSVNCWPSLIGLFLVGFGYTTIFQSALSYMLDTFTQFAASAVAANTFLRSTLAGSFPLFAAPMYGTLGINYSMTIMGGISAVLTPVPILFFIWGKKIRAKSKWSKHAAA